MAHNIRIDLNLLVVLECLYRHGNVSSAAQELGLSQSAISHSLARLRDHYKDPLFVRVSKGVAPTEFAKSLRSEVEAFTTHAVSLSEKIERFDPLTAEDRIVIATTDYFEAVVGPTLLERLRREAPGVQLSLRPTFGTFPKSNLEDGSYDMAIAGFYRDLPEGFYQLKLFNDSFSTAYRKGHPRIKGSLTPQTFYELEHALITLQGDFKDNLARAINGKKRVRKIKFGSASFTGPAWTISESDLVLTGPTLLLTAYERYFPIRVVPCPIEIKPIEIQMVWHGLTNQNPLRKWLRQVIKEICGGL